MFKSRGVLWCKPPRPMSSVARMTSLAAIIDAQTMLLLGLFPV